jgi:3-aminobutyryl-CoA ammonia-lyase
MTTSDPRPSEGSGPVLGLTVVHRRYVPYSQAHYAGNLVDGAYSLAAFGDVATELCIRTDGDEGLFASYSDVQFRAPVRAGDVIEIEAHVARVGTRSREMDFELRVVARGEPERGSSAARLVEPPIVATTARGVVVVPAAEQPSSVVDISMLTSTDPKG